MRILNSNKKKSDPQPDFELIFERGNIVFYSNKNNEVFLNNIDLIMNNGKLTFENGGTQIIWRPLKMMKDLLDIRYWRIIQNF